MAPWVGSRSTRAGRTANPAPNANPNPNPNPKRNPNPNPNPKRNPNPKPKPKPIRIKEHARRPNHAITEAVAALLERVAHEVSVRDRARAEGYPVGLG